MRAVFGSWPHQSFAFNIWPFWLDRDCGKTLSKLVSIAFISYSYIPKLGTIWHNMLWLKVSLTAWVINRYPRGQVAQKVRPQASWQTSSRDETSGTCVLRFGIKMAWKVFGLDSDPMWWGPVESSMRFPVFETDFGRVQWVLGWCEALFFVVRPCVAISSSCKFACVSQTSVLRRTFLVNGAEIGAWKAWNII